MSTYLDKWHYIRLGALILIASIIVTVINKFFIKNEKSIQEDIFDEEQTELESLEIKEAEDIYEDVKSLSLAEKNKIISKRIDIKIENDVADLAPVKTPVKKSSIENAVKPGPVKKETGTDSNKLIKESPKTLPNDKTNKPTAVTKSDSPAQNTKKADDGKIDTKPIDKKIVNDNTAVKVSPSVKEIKTSTEVKVTKNDKNPKKDINEKIDKIDNLKTVSSKISEVIEKNSVKVDKDKLKKELPATTNAKINERKTLDNKQNDLKNDKKIVDNADEINDHLNSLDDILDYAYAQKSKSNLKQAILAYQKALERYKNDEYAPFIAIDLGNIYKEQAAYSKVIKTYEEALKLPAVLRNASTYKEFTKNLAYLKIVQLVLLRHRALSTPFSKIPSQYFQEIETEFKSTQVVR